MGREGPWSAKTRVPGTAELRPSEAGQSRVSSLDDAAELPPVGTRRWVISRKAQLVEAVRSGLLSQDDVLERYGISQEEFEAWQRSLDQHGVYGLRVTRAQIYKAGAREAAARVSAAPANETDKSRDKP
jgi:hypothetical protein